jgi:hypothetical protein
VAGKAEKWKSGRVRKPCWCIIWRSALYTVVIASMFCAVLAVLIQIEKVPWLLKTLGWLALLGLAAFVVLCSVLSAIDHCNERKK